MFGRLALSPSFTSIMLTASSFIALISDWSAAVIADAVADISSLLFRGSSEIASSWSSGVARLGDAPQGVPQGGQGSRRCMDVGVAGELQERPGGTVVVVDDPNCGPVPNVVAGVRVATTARLDEDGPGEPTTNVGSRCSRRAGELAAAAAAAAAAASRGGVLRNLWGDLCGGEHTLGVAVALGDAVAPNGVSGACQPPGCATAWRAEYGVCWLAGITVTTATGSRLVPSRGETRDLFCEPAAPTPTEVPLATA